MNVRTFNISVLLIMISLFGITVVGAVPEFRVVLDPGHGGINVQPVAAKGDRYDPLSGNFLSVFKEGAGWGRLEENVLMYDISLKVKDILDKTSSDKGYADFKKVLKKYSSQSIQRIAITSFLSRKKSYPRWELEKLKDPNADYRLFDYPGTDGTMKPGRISYINSLKPQLVVSLHCAYDAPDDRVGMNAVISPSYSFMVQGLDALKNGRKDTSYFQKSPYADWFEENSTRSLYQWFLNDAALYFTGYSLTRSNTIDVYGFKGYRYNMVTWRYADPSGWVESARKHEPGSRYAAIVASFTTEGTYWERERSKYEEYRRDAGPEGYGGDNYYAGNELIRYILSSVHKAGLYHKDYRIGYPYVSVWSVPLYINAVSAYIELGYLHLPSYRKLLSEKQELIAEGIAAGIYSLLAGLETDDRSFRFAPKGKRIDFEKYRIDSETTYFDVVTE